MTKISKTDFETLESVAHRFSKQIESIAFTKGINAEKAFRKNASLLTEARMIVAVIGEACTSKANYDKRAKFIIYECENALPALQKAFGEDMLTQAMHAVPQRSEAVANLADGLGGAKLAALIRHTL